MLIVSLFTIGIIVLISIYYTSQRSSIYSDQKDNLSSIAILKLKQIELWRQERFGNAIVIRDNLALVDLLHQSLEKNSSSLKTELYNWMGTIRNQYDYSDVLLLDSALNVRMSFSHGEITDKNEIRREMKDMLVNRTIYMTDLKRMSPHDSVSMDLLIPLINKKDGKQEFFGILILRINPSKTLFPLIKLWPTASKSSETLLLRKDGDSVLYLNELRHKSNTALNLRLSLNKEFLLATMAARGKLGFVDGLDYRDIPVVGYVTPVPGFSWFMITKTDKSELLAPVKKYFFYSILISLLILLINTGLFVNWNRNQRIKTLHKKLADEAAIRTLEAESRKSEQQLIESEKLYRNLFENMMNGFAYCKILYEEGQPLDFLYIDVNKAFAALTGLTNVSGKKVSQVIPGIQKTDQELLQRYFRVSVSGVPETFEIYVEAMEMWFLISVYCPQKDYFVAVFDVITERKKVEASLIESEDKFKYVFDHSLIGKSITLPTGEIHVNKAFCQMTGYSAEELSSLKWQDITHPEDIEMTQNSVNSLLHGKSDSVRFNKRYIKKDGSVLWVDVSSLLRLDHNGKPLYFMTSINDITERMQAEEVLRNDEKRLRDLTEALPQLFLTCRPDGSCDYLSRQWVEYTGVSESQQVCYGWLEQLHPGDRQMTESKWKESIQGGESFDLEFRIRRADGEYHWFQTRAVPIRNSEHIITRWLGSNTDINSIRKAEAQLIDYNKNLEKSVIHRTEQLEIANKELEAFSYSVSHDLRAPLRAVHGFTKMLIEDYDKILDDEGRRICSVITSSATQMSELIDDLLSFSRIGRSSLNPSMLNMEDMAESVAKELTNLDHRRDTNFSIGDLHTVHGDSNLIKHVWNNLISNAMKYSSKEAAPEIKISSRREGDYLIYVIKDNGVGFDMKYANKLFGVFQRLHSESEFEGNGVGLAIVQRIISRHGGKIWAEGEPGKGATFSFSLPDKEA